MTSYSKEVIRDLAAGTLPWPQTRRIMSAYKDDDRFFKIVAVLSGSRGLEGSDPAADQRSSLHLPERRRARDPMRMRPFLWRLSQELEVQRRDQCAQHRGSAARDLSEQRHSRSAMDGNPRVHLPRAARCTRSRPAAPGYPIVHDFEPDLEGFYRDWLEKPLSPTEESRMGTLSGCCAIITGGLTGQGLAIANALAREGANVAVGSYVDEIAGRPPMPPPIPTRQRSAKSRGARRAWREGHSPAISMFANPIRSRDFVAAADSRFAAPPTSWSMPPARTAEQPVCGHSDELWLKIIDTNLNGAFRMTRELLPGMIERGWGRIINIGSTAASVGWKDNPAYCASKAGLLGLTRCVALEGAPHGVTCVMISPTWVETELMRRNVAQVVAREGKGRTPEEAMAEIAQANPQQRIIQPDEIAALAAFLCRDEAKGITMENIQITGGALW